MSQDKRGATYARAIYQMALEEWLDWLEAVQRRLAEDRSLSTAVSSEAPPAERQRRLEALYPAGTSTKFRQFLSYLADREELDAMDEIVMAFDQLIRHGPQVEVAYVTSAVELTAAERTTIESNLRRKFGDGLEFQYSVDPSLYGGVRVRVGDTVIDGSVAAQLEALRGKLAQSY